MYIFVDNFRGFKNSFIPIKEVNFFVGENSTGKSSILSLISLFSDRQFWYEGSFNTDNVKFGHFDDIASISSKDRHSFFIGFTNILKYRERKGVETHPVAHLIKYINNDGTPDLSEYFFFDGKVEVHIRQIKESNQAKYEYAYLINEGIRTEKDIINKVYKNWVKESQIASMPHNAFKEDFPLIVDTKSGSSINQLLWLVDINMRESTEGKTGMRNTISIFQPFIFNELASLAPIRTKPRRTYDEYRFDFSPEGEHTPYVVKRILSKASEKKNFMSFASKVGKESGLFKSITVKNYGKKGTSPFELDVILNDNPLSISNVGYGVSQVLPVIVELFSIKDRTALTIQQPEVHLHPKAQAALGSLLFDKAMNSNNTFLIETHSDYLIDRYRIETRKSKKDVKPSAQILFFDRRMGHNKAYPLEIDELGELPKIQPKKYRDFFVKEELTVLGLD